MSCVIWSRFLIKVFQFIINFFLWNQQYHFYLQNLLVSILQQNFRHFFIQSSINNSWSWYNHWQLVFYFQCHFFYKPCLSISGVDFLKTFFSTTWPFFFRSTETCFNLSTSNLSTLLFKLLKHLFFFLIYQYLIYQYLILC